MGRAAHIDMAALPAAFAWGPMISGKPTAEEKAVMREEDKLLRLDPVFVVPWYATTTTIDYFVEEVGW